MVLTTKGWDNNFHIALCLTSGIRGFQKGRVYPVIGWNNGWHIFGCDAAGEPVELIGRNFSSSGELKAWYANTNKECENENDFSYHFLMLHIYKGDKEEIEEKRKEKRNEIANLNDTYRTHDALLPHCF